MNGVFKTDSDRCVHIGKDIRKLFTFLFLSILLFSIVSCAPTSKKTLTAQSGSTTGGINTGTSTGSTTGASCAAKLDDTTITATRNPVEQGSTQWFLAEMPNVCEDSQVTFVNLDNGQTYGPITGQSGIFQMVVTKPAGQVSDLFLVKLLTPSRQKLVTSSTYTITSGGSGGNPPGELVCGSVSQTPTALQIQTQTGRATGTFGLSGKINNATVSIKIDGIQITPNTVDGQEIINQLPTSTSNNPQMFISFLQPATPGAPNLTYNMLFKILDPASGKIAFCPHTVIVQSPTPPNPPPGNLLVKHYPETLLDLGSVLVNSAAFDVTMRIQNEGNLDSKLTSVVMQSGSSIYQVLPDTCPVGTGAIFPPAFYCNLKLRITPTSTGTFTNAVVLTYTKADGSSSQTATRQVTLQVNGRGAISGSPTPLDFGSVAYQASAMQTLTVTNTGNVQIRIVSFDLTNNANNYFSIESNGTSCAANLTLNPAATCTIKGKFTANGFGNQAANLVIRSQDFVGSLADLNIEMKGIGEALGQVASGVAFGLAVVNAKAYAWGTNAYGQLGIGNTIQQNNPVRVHLLGEDVKQVSAGGRHACAIKLDGKLYCWGSNAQGQIGNGSTSQATAPQGPILTDAMMVATGFLHTCAVKTNGSLWCWGYGAKGNLGLGTTNNRTTPQQVFASGVIGIYTSNDHYNSGGTYSLDDSTFAIKSDGTAWGWGNDTYRQLGDNSTTQKNSPVQVQGLAGPAVQIAAMRYGTCFLTLRNGQQQGIQCVGLNNHGQLGNGSTTNRNTLTQVSNMDDGVSFLGCTYRSMCAIKNGSLYCWGNNEWGQLGNGTTTNSTVPVLASGSGFFRLSQAGTYGMFATKQNGTVFTWGNRAYGGLGDGGTSGNQMAPYQITLP